MNEETVQRHGNELDLGIKPTINLWRLTKNRANYTIEQVIATLEATPSRTNLTVTFNPYEPTPENNRRFIEPLCRCLSNLRCRKEHHPLRDLTLERANLDIHGMLGVFEQFLIAAMKYGGTYRLRMFIVYYLPIQFLTEFCRNNNNIKIMEANNVSFMDGRAALSGPPDRPQDSSVHLVLDKLNLSNVSFKNSTAVTAFANFISRMTVQALELGRVWASDDDDLQMTQSISSEIKIPSVKQLKLYQFCQIEHFKAALEAGTTSLVELDVYIDVYDKDDYTERLALLANFIRRACQMNSLTIRTVRLRDQPIALPREFLRAFEACATVTRIRVLDIVGHRDFSMDDVQQQQGIAARNAELGRFVASPSTYPNNKLLGLMRQFENCPTGRYMLAHNLPVVFSFEKIKSTDSLTTEPNPKKSKIS